MIKTNIWTIRGHLARIEDMKNGKKAMKSVEIQNKIVYLDQ